MKKALKEKKNTKFKEVSLTKQKLIRKLLKDLKITHVEIDPPREDYLEELLQSDYQELSSYYGKSNTIIKDLQERINKIKNQEDPQYNRKLASVICQELLQREKR